MISQLWQVNYSLSLFLSLSLSLSLSFSLSLSLSLFLSLSLSFSHTHTHSLSLSLSLSFSLFLSQPERSCGHPAWNYFAGHCYQAVKTSKTMPDASQHCQSEGGHLVSITWAAESDFVAKLDPGEDIWTGLIADRRHYLHPNFRGHYWIDTRRSLKYSNWSPGEQLSLELAFNNNM